MRLLVRRGRCPLVICDRAQGGCLARDDMPGAGRGSDDEWGRVQEEEHREDAGDKPAPR